MIESFIIIAAICITLYLCIRLAISTGRTTDNLMHDMSKMNDKLNSLSHMMEAFGKEIALKKRQADEDAKIVPKKYTIKLK